ncbi:MAG: hypothetical protein DYH05_09115 [Acidobacteria bacterium ACB1]|nr:hypothetical protein [Pyrinomonadaceae bacterium]MCE7962640.1 hypothetical protein [Acidobacteria bacterium ACB1]
MTHDETVRSEDLVEAASESLERPRKHAVLSETELRRYTRLYVVLPIVFLLVTLFGGMRFAAADHSFLFLPPPLICLIFGAVTIFLIFRARLIEFESWFNEQHPILENAANAGVILVIFTASVQVYNLLLPETGLANWVVTALFVWTLWNDIFADFDQKKLLRSLAGLFAIAFVTKYLVLSNLAVKNDASWLQRILENPGKEAATWFLDLPVYSPATGYLQFFTILLFLFGLFLTPRRANTKKLPS